MGSATSMPPIVTFDEPLPGPLNAALFWGKEEGEGEERPKRKGVEGREGVG
jgi:hypothetical protein